jgi:small subunit ribosomal protein S20
MGDHGEHQHGKSQYKIAELSIQVTIRCLGRRRLNGASGQVKTACRLTLRIQGPMFSASASGVSPDRLQPPPEVAVPRIKSAAKRMRQARVRASLNRTHRSQLRSALKRVRSAAAADAKAAYDEAVKLLDRAGKKNIIHKNAAARHKSRLAKLVAGKK